MILSTALRLSLGAILLIIPSGATRALNQLPSSDPGHKTFVTIQGIKVSCPNSFMPVAGAPDAACLVMRHEKYKLALFAEPEGTGTPRENVGRILAQLLREGVSEEESGYKWKALDDYNKVSKFERGGGMIQGFNGKQRVGIKYRELEVQGKRILVGYAFDLQGGAEARRLFEENLGGDSMPGWYAEVHVICSITGERYDELNPSGGGLRTTSVW